LWVVSVVVVVTGGGCVVCSVVVVVLWEGPEQAESTPRAAIAREERRNFFMRTIAVLVLPGEKGGP
jgi:hypothetical protein